MRRSGEDKRQREGAADKKTGKVLSSHSFCSFHSFPVKQGARRMSTSCSFLPSNLSRLCQAINKHGHKM